jgi:carbon-monoxide dehydrogenase medium subunit
MAYWKHYHTPATVDEAVTLLRTYRGEARVIGGGTDLLLDIQQGRHDPVEALIDVTRIDGLDHIEEEDGYLVLGAGVTHTRIVRDARLRRHASCLVESCGVIGGPQVRNVATLAGNVAHALPAGDGTTGLLTLDGELEVVSETGTHWTPMQETFVGPGRSTVDPTRMFIARLRFRPSGPGEGTAYRRVMRPQGVALPMIVMAAGLRIADDRIDRARVVVGPAGPVPFLARRTMALLEGKSPGAEVFEKAVAVALEETRFRSSAHRASSDYRQHMVRAGLGATLATAARRATGEEPTP